MNNVISHGYLTIIIKLKLEYNSGRSLIYNLLGTNFWLINIPYKRIIFTNNNFFFFNFLCNCQNSFLYEKAKSG